MDVCRNYKLSLLPVLNLDRNELNNIESKDGDAPYANSVLLSVAMSPELSEKRVEILQIKQCGNKTRDQV